MKTRFLVLSAFAFLLSTISSHADSVVHNTFGPGLSSRDFLVKEVVHEFTLESAILSESSATDWPQETPKAHSETKYVFLHMFIAREIQLLAVRFIEEQISPDLIRERVLFENGILDAA